MPRLVTLTLNPAVDLATKVGRVVAEDKLRCERPSQDPGGGGINVARAAIRLGAEALAVFPAGGPTGHLLVDAVRREDVPVEVVESSEPTRQNVSVTETSTDRQFRFVMPGAPLTEAELSACHDRVAEAGADLIVASGSLPPGTDDETYARLVRDCDGTRVIVDTSGPPLRAAVDAGAWLVKPNLRELADLVGRDLEDDADVEAAARELLGGGTQAVVVSMGAGGALLVTEDDRYQVRSPTVPIRSRVGAGDSSVAGIGTAVLRGYDLRDAVRHGVAAGAAAVMTEGSDLCRAEDVERLLGLTTDGAEP